MKRILAASVLLTLFALPVVAAAQSLEPVGPNWLERLHTAATLSFIVGGLIGALAGGGSALAMLRRVDKDTRDNAERLFESLSPAWQATIVRVVASAEEAVRTATAAVELLRDVTDGEPNAEPEAGDERV